MLVLVTVPMTEKEKNYGGLYPLLANFQSNNMPMTQVTLVFDKLNLHHCTKYKCIEW